VAPLSKEQLAARIEPDHDITVPEAARLWRRVLEQALADAFDPRDDDKGCDLSGARAWFHTQDCDIICERAGYDPVAFREGLRSYERRATHADT